MISNERWDGPGTWWPIFPIFWFAVITVLIIMVARSRRYEHRSSFVADSRIAERYAAGEIDESEYLQRLSVLRGSAPSGRGR